MLLAGRWWYLQFRSMSTDDILERKFELKTVYGVYSHFNWSVVRVAWLSSSAFLFSVATSVALSSATSAKIWAHKNGRWERGERIDCVHQFILCLCERGRVFIQERWQKSRCPYPSSSIDVQKRSLFMKRVCDH